MLVNGVLNYVDNIMLIFVISVP